MKKNKRILMIALDFPPCKSAGVQRTLKFAEYLQDFGWEPIILTVEPSAHELVDESQLIPKNIKYVYRSFSFNASRDFAIKGKYLQIMKEPDRWWSWQFTAVPLGKKIIAELKPDVIWSTYPVSTAHNIAYKLAKWSSLPWVADYRDPVQCRYDDSAKRWPNLSLSIEKKVLLNAKKVVFTSKPASMLYQSLYPDLPLKNFHVIENGYDEGNFAHLNPIEPQYKSAIFTMLHSGAIYSNGRDPSDLFLAISLLKEQNKISEENFQLIFRGLSTAGQYKKQINELNIGALVSFKGSINYMDSLKEMLQVDSLLLIQGALFNNQIPGKVFEYIRTGKPILAFTPNQGATAQVLANVAMSYQAENAKKLAEKIILIKDSQVIKRENIIQFSRYEKTKELVALLAKSLKL